MEDLLKQKIEEGFFKRLKSARDARSRQYQSPNTFRDTIDASKTSKNPEFMKKLGGDAYRPKFRKSDFSSDVLKADKDARVDAGKAHATRSARLQLRKQQQGKSSSLGRAISSTFKSGAQKFRKLLGLKPKHAEHKLYTDPKSVRGEDGKGFRGSHRQSKKNPRPIPRSIPMYRTNTDPFVRKVESILIDSLNRLLMEARGDTLAARYEKKTGRPFPEDLNVPRRGKKAGPRIEAAVRIARGK